MVELPSCIVVVVVVEYLYSASRSASNALEAQLLYNKSLANNITVVDCHVPGMCAIMTDTSSGPIFLFLLISTLSFCRKL